MNAPINILIHLLMAAFIIGSAGCALLIPVVAFRFISVLFEKDPTNEPSAV
jgi:hypothetical protein